MRMSITASRLRENVYRILDDVLEHGRPVDIVRRGRTLRIATVDPVKPLARLTRRAKFLRVDPDELVHMDWSDQWRP